MWMANCECRNAIVPKRCSCEQLDLPILHLCFVSISDYYTELQEIDFHFHANLGM